MKNNTLWNKWSSYWLNLGTLKRSSHISIYWRMPCLDWVFVFQEKIQTGAVVEDWSTFLKKHLVIFSWVCQFTFENPRKKGFIPENCAKLWYTIFLTWKFQGQKQRPMEIQHFFLISWSPPLETPPLVGIVKLGNHWTLLIILQYFKLLLLH